MDRQSNREVAESLLMDWHRWSALYRPALGAPRASPTCRDYRGSDKHDDAAGEEEEHLRIHQAEMEAVDFCVSSIAVPMQQAIGIEMKNRKCKSKVWSCPGATSFAVALDAVMVAMKKRGLLG